MKILKPKHTFKELKRVLEDMRDDLLLGENVLIKDKKIIIVNPNKTIKNILSKFGKLNAIELESDFFEIVLAPYEVTAKTEEQVIQEVKYHACFEELEEATDLLEDIKSNSWIYSDFDEFNVIQTNEIKTKIISNETKIKEN